MALNWCYSSHWELRLFQTPGAKIFTPIPKSGNKPSLSKFRGDCVSNNLGKVCNSTFKCQDLDLSYRAQCPKARPKLTFQTIVLRTPSTLYCTSMWLLPMIFSSNRVACCFLGSCLHCCLVLSVACSFDWVSIVPNMHQGEFIRTLLIASAIIISVESAHLYIVHEQVRFLGFSILSVCSCINAMWLTSLDMMAYNMPTPPRLVVKMVAIAIFAWSALHGLKFVDM